MMTIISFGLVLLFTHAPGVEAADMPSCSADGENCGLWGKCCNKCLGNDSGICAPNNECIYDFNCANYGAGYMCDREGAKSPNGNYYCIAGTRPPIVSTGVGAPAPLATPTCSADGQTCSLWGHCCNKCLGPISSSVCAANNECIVDSNCANLGAGYTCDRAGAKSPSNNYYCKAPSTSSTGLEVGGTATCIPDEKPCWLVGDCCSKCLGPVATGMCIANDECLTDDDCANLGAGYTCANPGDKAPSGNYKCKAPSTSSTVPGFELGDTQTCAADGQGCWNIGGCCNKCLGPIATSVCAANDECLTSADCAILGAGYTCDRSAKLPNGNYNCKAGTSTTSSSTDVAAAPAPTCSADGQPCQLWGKCCNKCLGPVMSSKCVALDECLVDSDCANMGVGYTCARADAKAPSGKYYCKTAWTGATPPHYTFTHNIQMTTPGANQPTAPIPATHNINIAPVLGALQAMPAPSGDSSGHNVSIEISTGSEENGSEAALLVIAAFLGFGVLAVSSFAVYRICGSTGIKAPQNGAQSMV